jgi:hypothetical protein
MLEGDFLLLLGKLNQVDEMRGTTNAKLCNRKQMRSYGRHVGTFKGITISAKITCTPK